MQRTQIYLPEDLRREVDRQSKARGESMAEYTRKALEERLKKEKKEKADLNKLADRVIGSLKISQKEAEKWVQEIREDRRLSDERLERRWIQAQRKRSS